MNDRLSLAVSDLIHSMEDEARAYDDLDAFGFDEGHTKIAYSFYLRREEIPARYGFTSLHAIVREVERRTSEKFVADVGLYAILTH